VTQPGIYQVRVLLKAASGVVVRNVTWNVIVDGRSPYYGVLAITVPSGSEFDIPAYNYQVKGRQVTWTDRLSPWVEWVNAWLSASSYVVDKLLQGREVEGSYKVVTFAGKVVEKAFASAKTIVGVGGSAVYINVGWGERTNTVVVSIIYPMLSNTDKVKLETVYYRTPGPPWFNVLTASSIMAAYTYDPNVD